MPMNCIFSSFFVETHKSINIQLLCAQYKFHVEVNVLCWTENQSIFPIRWMLCWDKTMFSCFVSRSKKKRINTWFEWSVEFLRHMAFRNSPKKKMFVFHLKKKFAFPTHNRSQPRETNCFVYSLNIFSYVIIFDIQVLNDAIVYARTQVSVIRYTGIN